MAADIPAGAGYLMGGLASGAVDVALIRSRRRFASWQVDRYRSAAARAPRGTRWLYFNWRGERWRDEKFRNRQLVSTWLPPVFGLAVLAVVLIASAITEFAR